MPASTRRWRTRSSGRNEPAAEAARILGAHARFAAFDYGATNTGGDNLPEAPQHPAPHFREGEPAYAAVVAEALAGIASDAFAKIVPARAAAWESSSGFDTGATLERLRARHPGAHTFSFGAGDGDEWLGATPETLLRVSDKTLRTEALAGTAPRARHAGDDARLEAALLADEKARREQRAVTDTLVARLSELGLDPVFPETPRVLRLEHARHLLTPVSAAMPGGLGALTVAGALHPKRQAVAGTPRDAALAALPRLEKFDRGAFQRAPPGWLDARGGRAPACEPPVRARARRDRAALRPRAPAWSPGVRSGRRRPPRTTLKLRTMAEALA